MFLGMKMFGIVIFRYERKFEVQGLVKPGFALFEMSGVKLIMEQRTHIIHSQHPPGLGVREFRQNFIRIFFHRQDHSSLSSLSQSRLKNFVLFWLNICIKTCS